MASVVSHLDASLSLRADIAAAMERVNLHVLDRFQSERFVTAALVHALPSGRIQIMDAGHGIIARVAADGTPTTLDVRGGPPLGAVPDSEYLFDELELAPGDRLLIFTDGVTEQNSSQGAMFTMEGALAALQGSMSAEEDTARVVAALRDHAGQATFDDDVTVVSIGRPGATR
jgi:sigma-B regulation protein RsbU (phosphoserine phosphatase)